MSTATLVPETRDLTGDDAWALLRRIGWGRLCKDAFQRLRVADGFSHSRSLAFMTALVAIQLVVGLVGLAIALGPGSVSIIVFATVQRAVPGPAGRALTTVVTHAHTIGTEHHYWPIALGLLGALLTGVAAMGQLERGLNRIYGIEQDRPTVQKYSRAFIFALSVGVLLLVSLMCLAFGKELLANTHNAASNSAWAVLRWPLGFIFLGAAITLVFRKVPRRNQPHMSWLVFGAAVSSTLWALSTAGLGLFYHLSSNFGQTYGPIAGTIALLFWCFLTSVSIFYGAAIVAQLEADRAGVSDPQDAGKVANSEPYAHVAQTSTPA
jgi:YihY family inner membrane protein